MNWLLLALTMAVPLALVAILVWLASLLAATETPQDVSGRATAQQPRSWLGRLRHWLTASPKRLDYRRDARGRFRKVRRG